MLIPGAMARGTPPQLLAETSFEGFEPEVELEQLLVCGALVQRDGSHYRIEAGDESLEELESFARRLSGQCDCGALLSTGPGSRTCRTCGRHWSF